MTILIIEKAHEYSKGYIHNNTVITCMVTDDTLIYCDDHFEMHRNVELLCCVPGTKVVL